ncbi:MAG: ROK family protein [Verrucomicrobiales bacterium]
MSSARDYFWGMDLGGTKIEGIVTPREAIDQPLCRLRVPTESQEGYPHIQHQIRKLLRMMSEKVGFSCSHLAIGTPGSLHPRTGMLRNSNTTAMNGQPLKVDLEKLLEIPVTMANDANCFALAEAVFGAGRGLDCIFGIILGTGVGGGLVMNGKAWTGPQAIAGEWGHNQLETDGYPCYCGKIGCVETVLSGPSLERFYEKRTGQKKKLPDIVAGRGKDPDAEATVQRLLEKFAEASSYLINILDPDALIIGGGVGNIPDLYTDKMKELLLPWMFHDEFETKILKPQLGDSAGVFGAALLLR